MPSENLSAQNRAPKIRPPRLSESNGGQAFQKQAHLL